MFTDPVWVRERETILLKLGMLERKLKCDSNTDSLYRKIFVK